LPIEYTHLLLYGSLAAFLFLALPPQKYRLLKTLLISNAISLMDELLQWIHPERVFDLVDLLLNLISMAVGLVLAWPFADSLQSSSTSNS
jgi:VanZ family protein